LLEAASSGLPIVATDVGGTREIFPSASNAAVLVPTENRSAFADAIRSLLSDDHRRQQLGAAARQRAESAFDIRNAAANLIEQYRTVLK
jgi:glycosyltransferase involved in cell wall biosynthesis